MHIFYYLVLSLHKKDLLDYRKVFFICPDDENVLIIDITPVDSNLSASCNIFDSKNSGIIPFEKEHSFIAIITFSIFSAGYYFMNFNIFSASLALSSCD